MLEASAQEVPMPSERDDTIEPFRTSVRARLPTGPAGCRSLLRCRGWGTNTVMSQESEIKGGEFPFLSLEGWIHGRTCRCATKMAFPCAYPLNMVVISVFFRYLRLRVVDRAGPRGLRSPRRQFWMAPALGGARYCRSPQSMQPIAPVLPDLTPAAERGSRPRDGPAMRTRAVACTRGDGEGPVHHVTLPIGAREARRPCERLYGSRSRSIPRIDFGRCMLTSMLGMSTVSEILRSPASEQST